MPHFSYRQSMFAGIDWVAISAVVRARACERNRVFVTCMIRGHVFVICNGLFIKSHEHIK